MINSTGWDKPFTSQLTGGFQISIVSRRWDAAILINPPKLLESSLCRYFIRISFCFDLLIRNPVYPSEWENHCEKIIVLDHLMYIVQCVVTYIFGTWEFRLNLNLVGCVEHPNIRAYCDNVIVGGTEGYILTHCNQIKWIWIIFRPQYDTGHSPNSQNYVFHQGQKSLG